MTGVQRSRRSIANFELLIAPTLAALANELDVLVVATTGGRPVDAIPGCRPVQRAGRQLSAVEWLLPRVDVLVTNGGYGSVNQAMSFGIPLVTAGMTEDKADVNARVAWSGVGVISQPTSRRQKRCAAVRTVSIDPPTACALPNGYEFARIDTRSEDASMMTRWLSIKRSSCGRRRWRSVSPGAPFASGDLIVARSEGGEVTLPSFRKHPRRKTVFNEDNDNV